MPEWKEEEDKALRPSARLHGGWPEMLDSLQAAYSELSEAQFKLQKRAAELVEARDLLERVIESMSEGLFIVDRAGRIVKVNAAAEKLYGLAETEMVNRMLDEVWPTEDIPTTPWELLHLAAEGSLGNADMELATHDGRNIPVSVGCSIVRDDMDKVTGMLVVIQDITERKRAQDMLTTLADASTRLAESLDYQATVSMITELALPSLGNLCLVYLVGEDATINRVAAQDTDPKHAERAERLRRGYPVDPAAPRGAPLVIRTGKPEFCTEASAGLIALEAEEPRELQEELEGRGIGSWMCVPLAIHGQIIGAISFISSDERRKYDAADLTLAEEVAYRAALALDSARMYQAQRGVAETLQQSLLPEGLPEIRGVDLAARYFPASPQPVGGDWYDVLSLTDDHVGLAMGDVAGHGVRAAATMGQLRSALRAYALESHPPNEVLNRLNCFIDPDDMATVAYLVLDLTTWTLTYAIAGHPPPLVVGPQGDARFLEGGNPPLLNLLDVVYEEQKVLVAPGSTVILYTDGLVEARGISIDVSLTLLREAGGRCSNEKLDVMLDFLLEELLQPAPTRDDTALLALRTRP